MLYASSEALDKFLGKTVTLPGQVMANELETTGVLNKKDNGKYYVGDVKLIDDITVRDLNDIAQYIATTQPKALDAVRVAIKLSRVPAIPPGQQDPISSALITDGMEMATFNNELDRKRYYQRGTVDRLVESELAHQRDYQGRTADKPVGVRTLDGTPLKPESVKHYTAKVDGEYPAILNREKYDLVAISPHKYHLKNTKGEVINEYDDATLEAALGKNLQIVGGRRKSRRVKKRHATRRAKKHTRRYSARFGGPHLGR
uniref:Uncharacterized protein n=1 Tax=viral metagenome TaxID=1070528 RepID=A0A6C0JJP8_9ZZZZ